MPLFSNVTSPTVTVGGALIISNNLTGAALLAADGYHSTLNSPARNQATASSITSDVDDHPRPVGSEADIGADEVAFIMMPIAGADGVIVPGAPQTIVPDSTFTATIQPNFSYFVVAVGVDGVSQGPVGQVVFSNVAANHTLTATFSARLLYAP
jgi:hypothetical protein